MAEFDPEKFEMKYVHYLPELEMAYKRAFETMNERYDSELVHAIDQRVLDESEPTYSDDSGFDVDLPESPRERVEGDLLVEDETFDTVLDEYVRQLRAELRRAFEFGER